MYLYSFIYLLKYFSFTLLAMLSSIVPCTSKGGISAIALLFVIFGDYFRILVYK